MSMTIQSISVHISFTGCTLLHDYCKAWHIGGHQSSHNLTQLKNYAI